MVSPAQVSAGSSNPVVTDFFLNGSSSPGGTLVVGSTNSLRITGSGFVVQSSPASPTVTISASGLTPSNVVVNPTISSDTQLFLSFVAGGSTVTSPLSVTVTDPGPVVSNTKTLQMTVSFPPDAPAQGNF